MAASTAKRTSQRLFREYDDIRFLVSTEAGGEGIKERADFLAFVIKRGVTLNELAWMENVYSPPIGALMEPIALAAQAGLREMAK